VSLVEMLQLTALIAVKDPRRHARVSARWLTRYLETTKPQRSTRLQHVVGALITLGGNDHDAGTVARITEGTDPNPDVRRLARHPVAVGFLRSRERRLSTFDGEVVIAVCGSGHGRPQGNGRPGHARRRTS
jgi:hypothetical protein